MADSIRKRLRDHLVETLQNAQLVEYVSIMADEPAELRHAYPSITVHPVDDEPAPGGAVGFETRVARFALEAWVRESERGSVADDVEALLAAIIVAVTADASRNGLAIDTWLGRADFLLILREQRLAGVEVEVLVKYRFRYGDPTAQV